MRSLICFLMVIFGGLQNAKGRGGMELGAEIELNKEGFRVGYSFKVGHLRDVQNGKKLKDGPEVSFNFQRINAKGESFMMGSPWNEKNSFPDERGKDNGPVKVVFTRSFEIMKTEVTQAQWVSVMGENPSHFKEDIYCDNHIIIDDQLQLCPDKPVEKMNGIQIQQFIENLNNQLGVEGCLGIPRGPAGCLRLPTEAEWEFAARGGTNSAYFFGDDPDLLDKYSWYWDNARYNTHSVGLKKANPYGLYDIHGNVWEWVQDNYNTRLPGGEDPFYQGNYGYTVIHVIRGGSYGSGEEQLRCAFRETEDPNNPHRLVGLRLVRDI